MRSAALLLATLAWGSSASMGIAAPAHRMAPAMVGGWSSAPADAQARKAAEFALKQLKRGKARIRSVDVVERQVVAGTNYRIDMTLTDKTRWRVVVWQRLDGGYRLTSSQRITLAAQNRIEVTGRVTYRERMALPAGSVVTIALNDVSRADAPAVTLVQQRIVTKGQQVPLPFTLSVDRNRLPAPSRNTVSVRIETAKGQLLWITDTINTVELDERGSRVDMGDLVLVRAGG
ncbi:MAG TPA: YbaY family lipoprotein [Chakrabartia sp.]|nr:YbaY family lipoprotein [Chakrabartia sp.]